VGAGGLTQQNFTTTLKSKLDGITAGANFINNTNQLTNGAGFITSAVDNTKLPLAGGSITGNVNFTAGDELLVGGTFANNAYNSNSSSTIYLGGGNDRVNYSIGTLVNNIGGNYTKLDLRWHTGIRMYAETQYGGLRYYSNNGMSTKLFSIGENDSHVRVSNNLIVGGTVDGRDVAADGTKLDGIATSANNYSFPYTVSSSAGGSTVVQRNSSGYVFANYFNTTPNTVTSGVTQVCVETANDGYIRHGSAAAIRSFINVANGANNFTGAPLNGSYNNDFYADDFYYDQWIRSAGASGLYWSATGWHLYVKDADDFYLRAGSGSCGIALTVGNETARGYVYADTSNYIGFLNSSRNWSFKVDNSGNCTATGNITAYSDIRLKSNIEPLKGSLDTVCKMQGIKYTRNSTGKTEIGFVAQDVKKVVPELVEIVDGRTESSEGFSEGVEDLHVMKYQNTVALLVEAIKELKAEVEELKNGSTN